MNSKKYTSEMYLKHARIFETENRFKQALACYKAAYGLCPSKAVAALIRKYEEK